MKFILYLILSVQLLGADLKLFVSEGKWLVSDLTNTCIQLFASADFKNWKLVAEFTNSIRIPTNRFYRAKVKPSPPVIIPNSLVITGTLARFSGFSTQPLESLWLTNNNKAIEGLVERMSFEMGEKPYVSGCSWKFIPFALPKGTNAVACQFTDTYGNVVVTNFSLIVLGNGPVFTIMFPHVGMEVVGTECLVMGKSDLVGEEITVDTGFASYPTKVNHEGRFWVNIPMQPDNLWTVIGGGAEVSLQFRRSAVNVTSSAADVRYLYGERGIVLSGTVSDRAYDLIVAGKRVSTTNGYWRIRVTGEDPMLPYSVIPKGTSFTSPANIGGVIPLPMDSAYWGYSFLCSSTYYESTNATKSIKTLYRGHDMTNLYHLERRTGKQVCSAQYEGIGEDLILDEFDGPCDAVSYRPTFPQLLLANYSDESATDKMGAFAKSGARLCVGGNPMDPQMYRVTVGLEVDEIEHRYADEISFENKDISGEQWKIGGKSCPWTFVCYNGCSVDVTPTMPELNDKRWVQYRITMTKEPAP